MVALDGRPVEDEFLDADLRVGANKLIERLDRRERIRLGAEGKQRSANAPGIAAELVAVLIQTPSVFARARDGLGQRVPWQTGPGLRLTAEAVPSVVNC